MHYRINISIGLLTILTSLLVLSCANEDSDLQKPVNSLSEQIEGIRGIQDQNQRQQKAERLWQRLKDHEQIPYTDGKTAVFLYKGEAEQVSWNGDFNRWSGDKSISNEGSNIPGTDFWYLEMTFPENARIDYKVTLNEKEWILDPHNPDTQWSGFGPNSVLKMPEYDAGLPAGEVPESHKGKLEKPRIMNSGELDYQVMYRVYTPAGYDTLSALPVIYVTDGHEYSDPNLGNMPALLDLLIYKNRIKPVIAVFVLPLNPDDPSENRRAEEFALNPSYLAFYAGELIPEIDQSYQTQADSGGRAIMGTSLGGLNATYFGFSRPDLFSKVGVQAPAYWYREKIYGLVEDSNVDSLNIYMSVGTIGDNLNDARQMKRILEQKNIGFTYNEVNEGHSWGAWKTQLDDLLIQFFGK